MVLLGISREDFWYSRPRDLQYMWEYYTRKDQRLLETLRMSAFLSGNLEKGTKYGTFCQKYMPMPWDIIKNEDSFKPMTDEEKQKLQNKVTNVLNNTGESKKVSVLELTGGR